MQLSKSFSYSQSLWTQSDGRIEVTSDLVDRFRKDLLEVVREE